MPEVTVTAHQPLALGTRPRAGAPAPTHLHIPGSVLRGALAARWIADHNAPIGDEEPPAEFTDLFEGGVRFGPLLSAGTGVVPLSVLRCKYQRDDPCARVFLDEAFVEQPKDCPHCHGPLRRGRGEVESFGDAAPTVRTTRVALGADETAEEGLLFTRDALRHRDEAGRPVTFTGRIIGGGDWLLGEHALLLGGRRSTSGLATYLGKPDVPAPPPEPTGDRLVLRLETPAVLVDSAGRPATCPDTARLAELLGVNTVQVARRWVRQDRIGGWNAAADLPKPDEHVVTAGSTFLLELGGKPTPDAVHALVEHGIGLRRTEGFGWIQVGAWHPPKLSRPDGDSGPNRVALGMSQMLVDIPGDHARWFAGELRSYLAHLSGGGSPHADLLRRPRLRTLDSRQRRLIEALLTGGDRPRIAAVIDTLEARIRGVL